MATHQFSRHPTVIRGEDWVLYEYFCLDCGVGFTHDCVLDWDDFDYHDYLSDIPCQPSEDSETVL